MSINFFGQFLIDQGDIDEIQLDRAIEISGATNLAIGQMAVQIGYLSQTDVELIHQHQRWRDLAFGELAIELGLLQPQDLLELLAQERTRHVQVGEALVTLGTLSRLQLDQHLTDFEADQAKSSGAEGVLPRALRAEPLFSEALNVLPTLSRRVAGVCIRFAEAVQWTGTTEYPIRVSMEVHAPQILGFGLALSVELAHAIATGMLGCPAEPDDLEDALGEYLNLILGHGKMRLGHHTESTSLGVPAYQVLPETGWRIGLTARCGKGSMILQPPE